MTRTTTRPPAARNDAGFTLIELMISVAIALIVTGSATALMVSIMQANGRNIASTRRTSLNS